MIALFVGALLPLSQAAVPGYPCPPDAGLVQQLFDTQLNFSYSDAMDPIKDAWDKRNYEGACTQLIKYYVDGSSPSWLRKPSPQPGTGRAGGTADATVRDFYDFYGESGTVPRSKQDRGLEWLWNGPDDDAQYMYALSRHGAWAVLAEAYQATGNPLYLNTFANLSSDWVAHNPAPASPDNTTWLQLEAGIRMGGPWEQAFFGMIESWNRTANASSPISQPQPTAPLTASAGVLPSPRPWRNLAWPVAMLASVAQHGAYLQRWAGTPDNTNWKSMQYNGLASLAVTWPELTNASLWFETAAAGVLQDAATGVYPDGVETEMTASYHWVATENFLHFVQAADRGGKGSDPRVLQLRSTVERMVNYTAYSMDHGLQQGAGMGPLNGDSDEYQAGPLVLPLARPRPAGFGRPDWEYVATRGASGRAPVGPPSVMFPWAGQLISRSSWGELEEEEEHGTGGTVKGKTGTSAVWSFFDVGPFGSSGHAHNDKLHLGVRPYGVQMLTDSGRFAYEGNLSRWRKQYGIMTRAHNTLRVDGQQQLQGPSVAKAPVPSSDWTIQPDYDWARGSIGYEGLQGTAVHTRAMYFHRGSSKAAGSGLPPVPFWVVVDRVTSDRSRTIEALWHTRTNCSFLQSGGAPSLDFTVACRADDPDAAMLVQPARWSARGGTGTGTGGGTGTGTGTGGGTGAGSIAWANATVERGVQSPQLQGWYSPSYSHYGPADALRFQGSIGSGGQNASAAWVLFPWQSSGPLGSSPKVEATVVQATAASVRVSMIVKAEDKTYQGEVDVSV